MKCLFCESTDIVVLVEDRRYDKPETTGACANHERDFERMEEFVFGELVTALLHSENGRKTFGRFHSPQ